MVAIGALCGKTQVEEPIMSTIASPAFRASVEENSDIRRASTRRIQKTIAHRDRPTPSQ